MVPLIMPLSSHDGDAGVKGITWPKTSCSSPFDYLNLKSGMVSLMTMLAWCDTYTSANGITWPKELCCTTCYYLDWRIAVLPLMIPLASHDVDTNGITWVKTDVAFFLSSWPRKWKSAIDDTVSTMWQWHQHQWHYMTKKVILHFVSIILT